MRKTTNLSYVWIASLLYLGALERLGIAALAISDWQTIFGYYKAIQTQGKKLSEKFHLWCFGHWWLPVTSLSTVLMSLLSYSRCKVETFFLEFWFFQKTILHAYGILVIIPNFNIFCKDHWRISWPLWKVIKWFYTGIGLKPTVYANRSHPCRHLTSIPK